MFHTGPVSGGGPGKKLFFGKIMNDWKSMTVVHQHSPASLISSTLVLHSVSAGGVYCAKTARARAAALGLDYPGVHGAPDFHEMQPSTMLLRPQPYENNDPESDKTEPNTAFYRKNQPEVRLFAVSAHKQAYPRRSESALGTHNPVRREYTTNQVLSFPRGQSVSNRKSNFEEVKHVAPPTRVEAPGLSDLVYWDPQGRSKPLSFVYNKHDLVVDESVPNRRGMSLSGLPLPQSQGHGTYQRGLTGFGLGGDVPVLASSHFPNKAHVRAMTGQTPVFGRQRRIVLRDRLPQSFPRNLNVRQFVQGNPVLRPKPKSDRISR